MIVPYLVWLAAFFDFADGFAARALKVSSPMGKELDSLSDMVSFGVVPAYLVYSMLEQSTDQSYLPFLGFSIAAFSALRLAKFNIDVRQSDQFIGLPTPANALFFTGLLFLPQGWEWARETAFLVVITMLFSYLLVAELPLLALKFKNFAWAGNQAKYILIIISVVGIIVFKLIAIPFIILFYILLSVASNLLSAKEVT